MTLRELTMFCRTGTLIQWCSAQALCPGAEVA